jgi:hypothetical protein|eukprot:COSAG03_NODE_24482_length_272_cov_0.595376_1_plen_46_part_00
MRCNARAVYLRADSKLDLVFPFEQCKDLPESVDKATGSPLKVFAV